MVDGRQRHEAPAAGALGGPDQVVCRQCAQRLTHGAAADAELAGEHDLAGQSLAPRELSADDQFAQLVVDLLVGLADADDRRCHLRLGLLGH